MTIDLDTARLRSALFDLDGVVTDTAGLHFAAWERVFSELAASRPGTDVPRFTRDDYRRLVDGRERLDGVASFLAARGVELPVGDRADAPGLTSHWAIANLKSSYFSALLDREGPRPYASSVALIEAARDHGMTTAVVTASRNCERILRVGRLGHLFDIRVDGGDIEMHALAGKPDPATFLEAARRLGVPPAQAALFEDAVSGVEAGISGGFGLVVGVDRVGSGLLSRAGAHEVVADLSEVRVVGAVRP